MNTEFKGTKEKVNVEYRNGNQYFYIVNENHQTHYIGQMFYLGYERNEEFKHNAEVASDALNTIQQCNLLPSELLKQNEEMRELLKEYHDKLIEIDKRLKKLNPTK